MVQKTTIYIAVIAVLSVCLLAAVGVLFIQASDTPLNIASLLNPTDADATAAGAPTAAVTFQVLDPVPSVTQNPAAALPQSTETPDPAAVETAAHSVQTCGMSGSLTLLTIGRDAFHWESPYGADAIRLIRVDFSRRQAVVFAFPRDLVVETARLKEPYGIASSRLGKVYLAVLDHEKGTSLTDEIAATTIAQVLYDDFGIQADYYLTLKEDLIGKLVNQFGGIDLDVPVLYTLGGFVIPAGPQHMDGMTAQLYIRRLESTEEEWGRFTRQNLVFEALRNKLNQSGVLDQVPTLYDQFQDLVVTDLSPSQIVTLSCVAGQIPPEDITFETIRRDLVTVNDNGAIRINDTDQVQQLLHNLGF